EIVSDNFGIARDFLFIARSESVALQFQLMDKTRLGFEANVFNVFNRTNFAADERQTVHSRDDTACAASLLMPDGLEEAPDLRCDLRAVCKDQIVSCLVFDEPDPGSSAIPFLTLASGAVLCAVN